MKNFKQITSAQNPEIKSLQKLKDAKYRKQKNQFIAEGLRVCSTLVTSDIQLISIYCTEKMKDYVLGFASPEKITLVSEDIMKKISPSSTPSGILCLFKIPESPSLDNLKAGIVLANISDPGNMGTLIRSAAAMGIKTVVIIEGTDPWSPKVIQSTAGVIGQVNIFEITWEQLVNYKKNLQLCALVVRGGKNPEELSPENSLLVIGNEAHGLPKEWIEQCEKAVTIPMKGRAESLNASVAGSIALYLTFANLKN